MGMPVIPDANMNQALADMIESIALVQTALSHILNADGELLQHFVNGTGTPAQIMAANNSVQSMANAAAAIEGALATKIQACQTFWCGCC